MNLAWIGLGRMGMPMARNLLRKGHGVTVFNRTRAKCEELSAAGAAIAPSVAVAGARGRVVATMLADDGALESVCFGAGGLVQSMPRGGVHVSMSTISVALSQRLAEEHAAAGQVYVSAPVFGRPAAAESGTLVVVPAGPPSAVAQLQPLFEAVGSRIFPMGEQPHMANVVKLSGNFMIASAIEAMGEAFALLRKYGVDPQLFLDMLTNTLFAAPVYKTYGSLIIEDTYQPVGFTMPLGLKDVRLALAAAEAAETPLPLASMIRDHMITALAHGNHNADWASVARLAAENAGLPPRKNTAQP